jgi:hypothetical protein
MMAGVQSPRDLLFIVIWRAIAILAGVAGVYVLVFSRGTLLPFMGTPGFSLVNLIIGVPLAIIAVSAIGIEVGLRRGRPNARRTALIASIILAMIFFALRTLGWQIMAGVAALHVILFVSGRGR